MYEEQEKYRKKKPSSTSSSSKKANHKHQYTECLIQDSTGHISLGRECSVCGILKEDKWLPVIRTERGYRMLTKEDVLQRYSHLEVKHKE